jgi:hypothetical protein
MLRLTHVALKALPAPKKAEAAKTVRTETKRVLFHGMLLTAEEAKAWDNK